MFGKTLPLLLAILAASPAARASFTYPPVVQDELKLTTEPSCTVCHETSSGGSGTVTTAFGKAVVSRGAKGGNNEGAVRAALKALVAENNPEVAKLRGGGAVVGPEYGCRYAPNRAGEVPAVLAALAVASFLVRRRAR